MKEIGPSVLFGGWRASHRMYEAIVPMITIPIIPVLSDNPRNVLPYTILAIPDPERVEKIPKASRNRPSQGNRFTKKIVSLGHVDVLKQEYKYMSEKLATIIAKPWLIEIDRGELRDNASKALANITQPKS